MTYRIVVTLSVAAVLALAGFWLGAAPSMGGGLIQATVTLDLQAKVKPFNPLVFGLNTAAYDRTLFPGPADEMLLTANRDAIRKVRDSGATLLKFPGGLEANRYVWNDRRVSPERMDTDEFLALSRTARAMPMITVNPNESPELAAAWVDYVNNELRAGVRYWEVGDEMFGPWAIGHTAPENYAAKFRQIAAAMKAKDPSILVGASLTGTPGFNNWNRRVLEAAGSAVDFVTFTWFPQEPGRESDRTLIQSAPGVAQEIRYLRQVLRQTLPGRGDTVPIHLSGWNSVTREPGPQTLSFVNAVWAADVLGTLLGEDVHSAAYWNLHSGVSGQGGDYGLLSNVDHQPRPTYYVFQLLTRYFTPDYMVKASSNQSLVSVYGGVREAAVNPVGHAILINKDAERIAAVTLEVLGAEPAQARAWLADETRKLERSSPKVQNGRIELELPPYSVTVLRIITRG